MYRWYRDPTLPLPRTEVTRFPHGVLEVKLSLPEGQNAPDWVQDLLDSGYLTEVRHPMQRRLTLARLGGADSCSCHFLAVVVDALICCMLLSDSCFAQLACELHSTQEAHTRAHRKARRSCSPCALYGNSSEYLLATP